MATLSANQGAMQVNMTPANAGGFTDGTGAWRGLMGNWINANEIAKEDWIRAEQAQNNQLVRDLYFQERANEFNAGESQKQRDFDSAEAQKQRDYDERMSNTQYQRAVADMKAAGINPSMAVSQGGNSWQGGTSASGGATARSSGSRSSSGNVGAGFSDSSIGALLTTAMQIGAGLITKGMSTKAQVATNSATNATKMAIANSKKQNYSQESYSKKGRHYTNRYYH